MKAANQKLTSDLENFEVEEEAIELAEVQMQTEDERRNSEKSQKEDRAENIQLKETVAKLQDEIL